MKLSRALYTLGFSLIILGLSLDAFSPKEYKEANTKLISYERSCMIEAIYYECRNCSIKEQKVVADVILNRTNHKSYPSTICGVINQPFQFSYKNNLKSNASIIPKFESMNSLDQQAYLEIESLVDARLVSGMIVPIKGVHSNVLFFHHKSVNPLWNKDRKHTRLSLDKRFKHVYYSVI